MNRNDPVYPDSSSSLSSPPCVFCLNPFLHTAFTNPSRGYDGGNMLLAEFYKRRLSTRPRCSHLVPCQPPCLPLIPVFMIPFPLPASTTWQRLSRNLGLSNNSCELVLRPDLHLCRPGSFDLELSQPPIHNPLRILALVARVHV